MTSRSTFASDDVWLYIDDKFTDLDAPEHHHITLEDEQKIRNLISKGARVFLSDGIRVWRYGSKVPMAWQTFTHVFTNWKRYFSLAEAPPPVKSLLSTDEILAAYHESTGWVS